MSFITCQCRTRLRVPDALGGKAGRCHKCRRSIRLLIGNGSRENPVCSARLSVIAGPKKVGEYDFLAGCGEIDLTKLFADGAEISGGKCVLRRANADQTWTISDLNQVLGLSVNGKVVRQHALEPGDHLTIGEYGLMYLLVPSEKPGEAPVYDLAVGETATQIATEKPIAEKPIPEKPTAPPIQPIATASPTVAIAKSATSIAKPAGTKTAAPAPVCPSCKSTLAAHSSICVPCGIHIDTGRPLITSQGLDENKLAQNLESLVKLISSVVLFFPALPVASEAYGSRKPYAMWTIMGITCAAWVALFFIPAEITNSGKLWVGNPTPEMIETAYNQLEMDAAQHTAGTLGTNSSDVSATPIFSDGRYFDSRSADYFAKKNQLQATVPPDRLTLATYAALPAGDRLFDHFQWYQLFLSLFIHASFLHLAGNMLFLYVFGGRVNALIGNVLFIPLYLLLGLAAGAANYFAGSHGPLIGTLGASGAIMGLAGVYFIFFPVQKIRIVAWVSLSVLWRAWGTFAIAGFWMLLLWIGLNDLVPTLLHRDDQIAHWEHLGGFVAGMAVALALLLSRQINARGADILSVMLGKYAWPLIGRPTQWRNDVPASILAQKVTSLTYR